LGRIALINAVASESRIDVKRSIFFRAQSKTKGEVRLDDNKIRIFGTHRANVTGLESSVSTV
jgi:hypothetical protein